MLDPRCIGKPGTANSTVDAGTVNMLDQQRAAENTLKNKISSGRHIWCLHADQDVFNELFSPVAAKPSPTFLTVRKTALDGLETGLGSETEKETH